MTDISMKYATRAGITISLGSLADGSWRQSASVSNTSNNYLDALVGGSIAVGTGPTSGDTIVVYAYGRNRAGQFTAGCSGSDAAYTANGEEYLLKRLQVIRVGATSSQLYEFGPCSIAQAFGGVLPDLWGIVVNNESGAALNSASHDIDYIGVEQQLV